MSANLRRVVDLAMAVLFPVIVFCDARFALDLMDYGFGWARALLCLHLVVGAWLLGRIVPVTPRGARVALIVFCASYVAVHAAFAGARIASNDAPALDIGTTTIAAVRLTHEGKNPYTERVDAAGAETDANGAGFRYFWGFKYGPSMRLAYTPGVLLAGNAGYFATTFLAWLLIALACASWASADGRTAAWGAAALALTPGWVDDELFRAGVNDAVPVALGIAAFAFRARAWTILAGLALGTSFAAKLFPAAIYALPLLAMRSDRVKLVAAATIAALAFYISPLLASPQELVASLVVFNMVRPADGTSPIVWLPASIASVLNVINLLTAIALCSWWGLRAHLRGPAATATVAAACVVLVFLGSRMVHRNYLIWFTPLLAVAVSARLWREPRDESS